MKRPERVRHKTRGTVYAVMTRGCILQTAVPLADNAELVIYAGKDGYYARPTSEFDDGRFELVPEPPRTASFPTIGAWATPLTPEQRRLKLAKAIYAAQGHEECDPWDAAVARAERLGILQDNPGFLNSNQQTAMAAADAAIAFQAGR